MFGMGADVIVVTDDGTRLWETGQWSIDSGIPLIIVNHATSEEPGMRTLAKYIQEKFPTTPVTQIPAGCIYKSIK
jgi:putative NIF3 family GTP cyclohydrolase 1 type 2